MDGDYLYTKLTNIRTKKISKSESPTKEPVTAVKPNVEAINNKINFMENSTLVDSMTDPVSETVMEISK